MKPTYVAVDTRTPHNKIMLRDNVCVGILDTYTTIKNNYEVNYDTSINRTVIKVLIVNNKGVYYKSKDSEPYAKTKIKYLTQEELQELDYYIKGAQII